MSATGEKGTPEAKQSTLGRAAKDCCLHHSGIGTIWLALATSDGVVMLEQTDGFKFVDFQVSRARCSKVE
jgi:hypothetical protein